MRVACSWEGGAQGHLLLRTPFHREVRTASELVSVLRSVAGELSHEEIRALGLVYTFLCLRECAGSGAGSLLSRIGKYQDQFFPEVADDDQRRALNEGSQLLSDAVFAVRSDYDHIVIDRAFEAVRQSLEAVNSRRAA